MNTEVDVVLIIALRKCGSPPLFLLVTCTQHTRTYITLCYLVWLCTHCPRWAWPGQSQRSCTLDYLQQGCWLLAGHDGYSSSAQCMPFQLQSAWVVEYREKKSSGLYCEWKPFVCQSASHWNSPVPPCQPAEAASGSGPRRPLRSPANFLKTTQEYHSVHYN